MCGARPVVVRGKLCTTPTQAGGARTEAVGRQLRDEMVRSVELRDRWAVFVPVFNLKAKTSESGTTARVSYVWLTFWLFGGEDRDHISVQKVP